MKTETNLWIGLVLFAFSATAFFLLWANQLEKIPAKAGAVSSTHSDVAAAGMEPLRGENSNVLHPGVIFTWGCIENCEGVQ